MEVTSRVVSAFVTNNAVATADLAKLIVDVHTALSSLASPAPEVEVKREPAVPVRKSVTPDFIVCLEDGRKFKSLKRHLRTHYGLSPAEYRQKWNLPSDYPMVAPNYAAARSALAKAIGLGQARGASRSQPAPIPAASPKPSSRTKKAAAIEAAAPAPKKVKGRA